jgi:hypothetical protein
VTLSIDADKASMLKGDLGFLSPDGDYGLPMSGLEQRGELLAWSLARVAMDEIGDSLRAYIVNATASVGDVTLDESFDF